MIKLSNLLLLSICGAVLFSCSAVDNENDSAKSAVVSDYSCSTASEGTMISGSAVSGATQTITASVARVGTYSISAVANGVTFAGSGTFADVGSQNIVLTATGTPLVAETSNFVLNTTPNCNFNRTIDVFKSPTTNGTAIVSSYSCSTASAGTMTAGSDLFGVTQTITANVSTVGTYSISAVNNGVTFAGEGTFAVTGSQDVVLTATGAVFTGGTFKFVLNTTPNCDFDRPIGAALCGAYVADGVYKLFMCHNLGADTSLDPSVPVKGIQGNYYQWGRSAVVADASTPPGEISGWNTASADNGAWADGTKTANDPCPAGFRVPTNAQWVGVKDFNRVTYTGTWTDTATNFGNAIHVGTSLTLPAGGSRRSTVGSLAPQNVGFYWSSTEDTNITAAKVLSFTSNGVYERVYGRAYGFKVRCVSE